MSFDNVEMETQNIFEGENAIWFFDYNNGGLRTPHAELTSGLCSDGYINCRVVLSDPQKTHWLAIQLVKTAVARGFRFPEWVVGSAYAAITFSYEVARLTGAKHGFTQKDPKDEKKMVWVGPTIPEGATVLQCEELITTLGTTTKVREAIQTAHSYPINFFREVLTIAYRPGEITSEDRTYITALIYREVKTWHPRVCPLCGSGSPRVRPSKNWTELTGKK
jgi:orotate phosphoribosyltransferase